MKLLPPRRPSRQSVARALTVLACALLVASLALATLVPSDMNLLTALNQLDPSLVSAAQHAVAPALWNAVAMPLLLRPTWLVPVCLGVVCIGGAISAATPPSRRTTHRRS